MPNTYMACGCRANSVRSDNGESFCVIHLCGEQAVVPDLTNRMAKCIYGCGSQQPSSLELPFFEYRGEGSKEAVESCGECHYHEVAHKHRTDRVDPRSVMEKGKCTGFKPVGPARSDKYYCGCMGWD
jgi:hypothetical protein